MVDKFTRKAKLNLLTVILTVGSIIGGLTENRLNIIVGLSSHEVLSFFIIASLMYYLLITTKKEHLLVKHLNLLGRLVVLLLSTTFSILITQFLRNDGYILLLRISLIFLLYMALWYKIEEREE